MRTQEFVAIQGVAVAASVKTAVIAIPVALALQAGRLGAVLVVLAAAALGYLSRSSSLTVLAVGATGAAGATALFLVGRLWPNYTIDVRVLLTVCAVLALVVVLVWRERVAIQDVGAVGVVGTATILSALVWPSRSFDNGESLAFLAGVTGFPEDNGAWLRALAEMSRESDTVFTRAGTYGAGHGTEFTLGATRELTRLTASWFDGLLVSNTKVLVAAISLSLVVFALVAMVLVRQLTGDRVGRWGIELLPLPLGVFALVAGMAEIGHYSAVVAGMFLTLALAWAAIGTQVQPAMQVSVFAATSVALFAAGLSWFVFLPVVVLVAIISGRPLADPLARQIVRIPRPRAAALVVVAVLLGVFVVRFFFGNYSSTFLSWSRITYLLGLGSPARPMRAELIVLILAGTVVLVFQRAGRFVSPLLRATVGSMLLALATVVAIAWSIPPFVLSYGPVKMTYIVAMALAPVAYAFAVRSAANRGGAVLASLFGALAILIVAWLPTPGAEWTWMHRQPDLARWSWAPAVAKVAERRDRQPIGCITLDELGRPHEDASSAMCSRLTLGLTRGTTPAHYNWMAAQYCGFPSDGLDALWNEEFFQQTIFIVTPVDIGKACGESEKQPLNPFENIDWSIVRFFDLDGKRWQVG